MTADKHKNNRQYQNETGNNVVFQVRNHQAHIIGLIGGEVNFQGLRQFRAHFVDHAFDFIGDAHDVFAAALQNGDGHAFFLVDATAGQRIFEGVFDGGHIPQVNRFAIPHEGHDGKNFRRMPEIFRNPHQVFSLTDIHASAGHVHIAFGQRSDDAGKRHIVSAYAIQIEFHKDFALQAAAQTGFQNPGDGFKPVLNIFG